MEELEGNQTVLGVALPSDGSLTCHINRESVGARRRLTAFPSLRTMVIVGDGVLSGIRQVDMGNSGLDPVKHKKTEIFWSE